MVPAYLAVLTNRWPSSAKPAFFLMGPQLLRACARVSNWDHFCRVRNQIGPGTGSR